MKHESNQNSELSQHQLVTKLLEGAVAQVSLAHEQIEQNKMGHKGEEKAHIMRAIAILDALRGGLDREAGGEIAENLYSLYDYMGRRLVDGYQAGDVEIMNEVTKLLGEVLDGWQVISSESHPQESRYVEPVEQEVRVAVA